MPVEALSMPVEVSSMRRAEPSMPVEVLIDLEGAAVDTTVGAAMRWGLLNVVWAPRGRR